MSNRFTNLVGRALRLVCPFCGRGRLFRSWLQMHERCSSCGMSFEREPGFYLGSIYFNYGLTALVVAIAYPVMLVNRWQTETIRQGLTLGFAIVFPIWFHRYARSLWLGFDQFHDPRPGEQGMGSATDEKSSSDISTPNEP